MVHRDPETGQFVSDGGAKSSYLNHDLAYWATAWGGDPGNFRGNWDAEYGNNNIGTYVHHEIEVPENHLVEIHGFEVLVGDPNGGGEDAKADIWVYNDTETGPTNASWATRVGEWGESMIYHSSFAANNTTGYAESANTQIWFDEPILSTGNLAIHHGWGDNEGGELGVILYYDFVEAPKDEIMEQLLQVR